MIEQVPMQVLVTDFDRVRDSEVNQKWNDLHVFTALNSPQVMILAIMSELDKIENARFVAEDMQ